MTNSGNASTRAENACNAIGANPLVARVCALFHDVGKTANAAYFAENQRDGLNPHDALPPAESARLIRQHVPDGVDLAHKHNLPRSVIDVNVPQRYTAGLSMPIFMAPETTVLYCMRS